MVPHVGNAPTPPRLQRGASTNGSSMREKWSPWGDLHSQGHPILSRVLLLDFALVHMAENESGPPGWLRSIAYRLSVDRSTIELQEEEKDRDGGTRTLKDFGF